MRYVLSVCNHTAGRSRKAQAGSVREVGGLIDGRVRAWLDRRLEDIRAYRRCDETPPPRLLPALDEESAGQRSAREIRACVDIVPRACKDAWVSGFVAMVALRRARVCLLGGPCRPHDALS
jgi:hypothetical protein